MSDSQSISYKDITACGLLFPNPDNWLPLDDHSGRACEISVDAYGESHEMVWLFLNYSLLLCKSHGRQIAGIGLPREMYRGLNLSETEIPLFKGHPVLESCILPECDHHLLLIFQGDENRRNPLPAPGSWLPRGRLGASRCLSSIDIGGTNIKAAMAFLEGAIEVCRKRAYQVDTIISPWDINTAYPGGIPSRLLGIDWAPDLFSPFDLRIGLEYHQG